MSQAFELKGWHVLAMLGAFFLVILVANTFFLAAAIRTFPGEQEEKSYLQGLDYNRRIEERASQAALGWSVRIVRAERDGDGAEIEVLVTSASAKPLYGLVIEGVLSRPADDDFDRELIFLSSGPGLYRAHVENVGPGGWRLGAVASDGDRERLQFEAMLVLE